MTSERVSTSGERPAAVPYSVIAAGYDLIMAHVLYEEWAEYVRYLLARHHPEARTMLELGCGTGSLALELQALGAYRYTGTDLSAEMIAVAREKARRSGADLRFEVADFTDFEVPAPVDVVLLLFDGLNYLLDPGQVERLLACTHRALKPGGIFLFDQSTPANSLNNEAFFEDEGETDGFAYVRRSRYDAASRLHTTVFDITALGHTFQERHVQRAYEYGEILPLIERAGFDILEALDGFTFERADETSERIHWLVRRI